MVHNHRRTCKILVWWLINDLLEGDACQVDNVDAADDDGDCGVLIKKKFFK